MNLTKGVIELLFEYMDKTERHWIGMRIGNHVSHQTIKIDEFAGKASYGGLKSIDEINTIDRKREARSWYSSEVVSKRKKIKECYEKYGVSESDFLEEVAIWIDERIPRAYKKNLLGDGDKGPAQQKILVDENGIADYGLIYHFSSNVEYMRNSQENGYSNENLEATVKQINYIISLASKNGYHLLAPKISLKQAATVIDCFLNHKELPMYFKQYLVKKEEK